MNSAKIYSEATTPQSKKDEKEAITEKKKQDSAFASGIEYQEYLKWVEHPITQELVKYLADSKKNLLDAAIVANRLNNDHAKASSLTAADTINEIIKYATRTN